MGAKPRSSPGRGGLAARLAAAAVAAILISWVFPLFHVMPLHGARASAGPAPPADLSALADKFWRERLEPSAAQAPDAATVLAAVRADFHAGTDRYAHKVGLGGLAYFYVSGEGRVVRAEADRVLLALGDGGSGQPVIALQTGPVFGNTVRDGTGLLNVNDFPSLDEFNAFAAKLDQLVEARVLPVLRARAVLGSWVSFAGCAEAPDDPREAAPLAIVPVRAEVR